MKNKFLFDVVVVGSGPNGLAAAIFLQQKGVSVLLLEGKKQIGGGLRTAELTLPGYQHDICSAIHPMAVNSPFFQTLPLSDFGLEFIYPEISAAHPFDDGSVAFLSQSIEETAAALGRDASNYKKLIEPIVQYWPQLTDDILAPLHFPKHALRFVQFGLKAFRSAASTSSIFTTEKAKGLFAGMAAHSIQPLTNLASSAIALVLMAAGHVKGWPIPKGGSVSIAKALAGYFQHIGGKIETDFEVKSFKDIPESRAVLFDLTPRQLLEIAGYKFSRIYQSQLNRYRYGMGVFKMDFALHEPIPFTAAECSKAATVHLGNTFDEIAKSEQSSSDGFHPENPFVLLAQQSLFDESRAPSGKHTAWAYCHVPNGSQIDMSRQIEQQIERFAPGFKDCIIAKHMMHAGELQAYNSNYVGGDINGGLIDWRQLFSRPALRWSPYRTSAKGIYICSSSTPPGGGVHGMCGYHAAKRAWKDSFQ